MDDNFKSGFEKTALDMNAIKKMGIGAYGAIKNSLSKAKEYLVKSPITPYGEKAVAHVKKHSGKYLAGTGLASYGVGRSHGRKAMVKDMA